jgi:peptidoglycan hydrolase CwlO-like protein|uniref:Lipoprotein n=1 Tax=candidate division WOR-3 bacterium TaxID=2052148 RepID=A0A7V3KM99_UNCW3
MSYKKMGMVFIAGALLLAACGPKKATKQTLAQLEECNKALQSAEQKKAELQANIDSKNASIEAKKAQLSQLQAERDSLSYWLHEVLEKGY